MPAAPHKAAWTAAPCWRRRASPGISDVVEAGYGGFLSAIARTPNPARLLDGLGTDLEVAKRSASRCIRTSPASTPRSTRRAPCWPGSTSRRAASRRSKIGCGHMTFVHTAWDYRPAGVTAAQMNMFYGIAVMALRSGRRRRQRLHRGDDRRVPRCCPSSRASRSSSTTSSSAHGARLPARCAGSPYAPPAARTFRRRGAEPSRQPGESHRRRAEDVEPQGCRESRRHPGPRRNRPPEVAGARSRYPRQRRRHPEDRRPGTPPAFELVSSLLDGFGRAYSGFSNPSLASPPMLASSIFMAWTSSSGVDGRTTAPSSLKVAGELPGRRVPQRSPH